MKTNDQSIQKVQDKFKYWRANNPTGTIIPNELMAMVINLCKKHPVIEVSRELKIPRHKIEAELLLKQKMKLINRSHNGFVTIPLVASSDSEVFGHSQTSNLSCELLRPDGVKMRIHVDQNNFQFVMSTFFGGQQC
jgi:hypothetical protein